MAIKFNTPFLTGKELEYVMDACQQQQIAGGGSYSKRCHQFFEDRYGFAKVLLTTSCTDALEMAAILLDIQPGDEVIVPSYTFVSTANAFILRGARIVFADVTPGFPNLDISRIEELVNPKTKAIIAVHYAGVACDMQPLMDLANRHGLFVVEDAAQGIDAFYHEQPLGGIGHLGCFSFHETKNISAGEGGLLIINDQRFIERASVIWEKGTNRSAFARGEVKKYEWMDIGSSFLPSELTAAFLYAQLEQIDLIQQERKARWNYYEEKLRDLVYLPGIPQYANHNAHIFFLLCASTAERRQLIDFLRSRHIQATSHYLPLHLSPYYEGKHDGRDLPCSEFFAGNVLRLPLHIGLTRADQDEVIDAIRAFLKQQSLRFLAPASPVVAIPNPELLSIRQLG